MPRGITENDVWTACDALLVSGSRPTIERVRHHLGRGSPNTVGPHLDSWFKGLGPRIHGAGGFGAAVSVPEPVQAAATNLWEAAQAEARRDLQQRVADGLAAAEARVQASDARALQAEAALQSAELAVQRGQDEFARLATALDQALRDHAAEKARVDEVRTALAASNQRNQHLEAAMAALRAETALQLAAAVERADAADRRVALELDRERSARAKAERAAESSSAKADAARRDAAKANAEFQRKLDAAHAREQELQLQLADAAAALAHERARYQAAQDAALTQEAAAHAARQQVATLQQSLDRLTTLLHANAPRPPESPARRKRSSQAAASSE